MTGQELYDLTTKLLGGIEIDVSLFTSLLNMAKTTREGQRDWVWLKKKDTSITCGPGYMFLTPKSTPSDFGRPVKNTDSKKPIVLLDSNNKVSDRLTEIEFERQFDYMDTPGYFYVDYSDTSRPIYFTGTYAQQYTAALFYIRRTTDIADTDISDSSTWTWENFPSKYHSVLAYDVAIMHKGDIDFDSINARMVQFSGKSVSVMEFAMSLEDDRIKLSTLGV